MWQPLIEQMFQNSCIRCNSHSQMCVLLHVQMCTLLQYTLTYHQSLGKLWEWASNLSLGSWVHWQLSSRLTMAGSSLFAQLTPLLSSYVIVCIAVIENRTKQKKSNLRLKETTPTTISLWYHRWHRKDNISNSAYANSLAIVQSRKQPLESKFDLEVLHSGLWKGRVKHLVVLISGQLFYLLIK